MDIFEFAMDKEKLSEQYYLELRDRTSNEGLSTIFGMLAEEEAKHRRMVGQMREQTAGDIMAYTDILASAREVFTKMREATDKFNLDISEVELYKKAQRIEEEARNFYLQKAGETENAVHQGIFNKLADEEKKHYYLLDNIIEFVLRPERWLENAEFFHPEPY
jgi:rubrerythrin